MDYPKFFEDTRLELMNMLNERKTSANRNEQSVQAFFETYPFALLSSLEGIESSHSVVNNIVVSQPTIKSQSGDRSPDFLIVTHNSLNTYFNFIELEDPSKKIFKNSTTNFTNDFYQAHNQLIQWGSFTNNEVRDYCHGLLTSLFNDGYDNELSKNHHYNFILVYGFSDEVSELTARHNDVLQERFTGKYHHCTYSRLLKNYRVNPGPMFTVKKDSEINKFKAIGFTPFRRYLDHQWFDFHNITGKQELVSKCSHLTEEEKNDLMAQMTEKDKMTRAEVASAMKNTLGKNFSDLVLPW